MFEGIQEKLSQTLKSLSGQAKIRPAHIEQALEELKTSLLEADVQYQVATQFLARVKERALGAEVEKSLTPYQQFLKILSQEMLSIFGDQVEIEFSGKPPLIAFMVGLQGTGKTTSAAKLALYLRKKKKRRPLLVSVDVTRPAAIEQLERMAKDSKLDYFNTSSMNPLERAREAVKYAQTYGLDFVIVDTAGRLSIDEALMQELTQLRDELHPQFIWYVVDAMSGQQGLAVAQGFSERVGLTGAILTKADGDTRGGVSFSIRAALQVPLQFVGLGEKAEAFEPFIAKRWISRILGMGDLESLFEKAQEVVEATGGPKEDELKRLSRGELTLADFQTQMKMMSKMGSLTGMMGMVPGMASMARKIDQEQVDRKLKRIDAMINSMTKQERLKPDMINGDRKRRISKGSGTQVEEINQFLREFYEMQKLMKSMAGKKFRGLGALLGR